MESDRDRVLKWALALDEDERVQIAREVLTTLHERCRADAVRSGRGIVERHFTRSESEFYRVMTWAVELSKADRMHLVRELLSSVSDPKLVDPLGYLTQLEELAAIKADVWDPRP